MNKTYRYFGSMLLTATFVAPLALSALAPSQERREERREERERERYYDKHHKDYHDWDDNENRCYHIYLEQRRRPFIEFRIQRESERQRYWRWRHEHPEYDRR